MRILSIYKRNDDLKKKTVTQDEFIRKRMARQRKIRKRRMVTFFCFFIFVMICVGITLSLTVFFPINSISVKGSKIYSASDIVKHSGIQKGDNLFTVSRSGAEQLLKQTLPYVESLELERQLPDKLILKVKDAEEFACYNVKGRYYTVSRSGWVLKENPEKPENLIEIIAKEAKCKVGSEIVFKDERPLNIIDKILAAVEEEKLQLDTVDVTEKISIKIKVEGRFDVTLGNSNNLPEKIRHLAGMIEYISPEKEGSINLSMWTSSNTEGTFTEKKSEN